MTRNWIAEGRAVAALTGVWFGLGAAAPASAYIRIDEFTDTQSVALTGAELSVGDSAIARLTINGTFPSRNVGDFTHLTQEVFGLHVEKQGDIAVLSR